MANKKIKRDKSLSAQHIMVIDIFHTASKLEDVISEILKDYEITHQQYNIIKNVYSASPDPLSVMEIKETTMFRNSDITRLIDRLVAKELLIRKVCPENRRKIDITIAKKGMQYVEQIQPKLNEAFNGLYTSEISIEDGLKTTEVLRSLRKKIKEIN